MCMGGKWAFVGSLQDLSGSQVGVSTLEYWIVLQTLFPGQWALPVRAVVQGKPAGTRTWARRPAPPGFFPRPPLAG